MEQAWRGPALRDVPEEPGPGRMFFPGRLMMEDAGGGCSGCSPKRGCGGAFLQKQRKTLLFAVQTTRGEGFFFIFFFHCCTSIDPKRPNVSWLRVCCLCVHSRHRSNAPLEPRRTIGQTFHPLINPIRPLRWKKENKTQGFGFRLQAQMQSQSEISLVFTQDS